MASSSKRMKAWKDKSMPAKTYPIDEALELVKEFATAKFNESVDVAVNLGIDATQVGPAGARFHRDAARHRQDRARGGVHLGQEPG